MRARWVVLLVVVGCGGDDELSPDAPTSGELAALDQSLIAQVDQMNAMTLSSVDLTAGYRSRIQVRDLSSTGIKAFLALDFKAADVAATVDGLRGTGAKLQGAVFGVKDNLDTANYATTAGSTALANNLPATDATVVAKLRAANAVIMGKTNLSEWANFRSYKSTSGWSAVGGQTKNGKVPGYNPCGSSSGSAAAVSSRMISAAIGTETQGSIVCPASVNGVVGFKPTVGLVSRAGIIPISSTQDTAGPITVSVADAARVLTVIAGPDAADPATAAVPPGFDFDFEAQLAGASLAGKRLGVVRSFQFQPGTTTLFEMQLATLAAAGAVLVDVNLAPESTYAMDDYVLETYEFKVGINAYLASHARANQPASLAELILFDAQSPGVEMPYFAQEIFLDASATTGLAAQEYLDAKTKVKLAALDNGIVAAMTANNLDALVAPTSDPAWLTSYATGDLGAVNALYAAAAGAPHLTVPMGTLGALPVGISFFARPFDDAAVLRLGYAYEQARGPLMALPLMPMVPRAPAPAYATAGR